jgi:hypothetical protein
MNFYHIARNYNTKLREHVSKFTLVKFPKRFGFNLEYNTRLVNYEQRIMRGFAPALQFFHLLVDGFVGRLLLSVGGHFLLFAT